MRIGGYMESSGHTLPVWLNSASSGETFFPKTRWWMSCWEYWVLDITRPAQFQRIAGRKKFLRPSGRAALYRPSLRFEEWQEAGKSAHESWVLFSATDEVEDSLNMLTTPGGYCHFDDSELLIAQGLQTIAEALFHRNAGSQWLAQGTFLTLLSHITQSQQIDTALRSVSLRKKDGLSMTIENFIWANIEQPIQVEDLARHVGLGVSAFSHRYRALAGEPPYQTILRLKMEAAKRKLIDESASIKETASQLGFSSEFHFSRCFKRIEGQSPSAYVQAMNAKRQ